MSEEDREWKQFEGYLGIRAMQETMMFEFLPETEQEEYERLAPIDTSWKFVDADESEDIAAPTEFSAEDPDGEVVEFDNIDDYIDATYRRPYDRLSKDLTHQSMITAARARVVAYEIVERCRFALRDRTHANAMTMCDSLSRIEREVYRLDQELRIHHLRPSYEFCSVALERACDILDALMSRDEKRAVQDIQHSIPVVTRRENSPRPFSCMVMVKGTNKKIASTAIQAQFLVGQGWQAESLVHGGVQ